MLKRSPRLFTLLAAVLLLAHVSCKKDKRVLDASVLPPGDQVSTNVSTYTFTGRTLEHDSILSFNSRIKFLGSSVDPVFGRTDIGLYVNVNFAQENGLFDPAWIFEGAEFLLNVDNAEHVGNENAQLSYSVFPLDSSLSRKRIYYTSNTRLHARNPLPGQTVTGAVAIKGKAYLRIALDAAYAGTIFHDYNAQKNLETFQATYKGFYLAGSPQIMAEGCIYKCDLDEPGSGLYFYYRKSSSAAVDTMRLTFTGDRAVRFNTVVKDRSGAGAELKAQLAGTSQSAENFFVQGMGGTQVRINIPLQQPDSFKIAVNRAEMVFPIDNDLSGSYDKPPFLSLLPLGSRGQDTVAADQYNVTDNARYNGMYDAANSRYVFNIARHVQAILNGEIPNRGFNLVLSNPSKTSTLFRDEFAGRIVLTGPDHSSRRPSLTLSYSRISVK